MDNYSIADNFSLLAKLMDIHGDNSFKAKSYSIAAYTVENLPVELNTLPAEKIFSIKGIGDATGKKIIEQIQTGRLVLLDEYLNKTPVGVIEMLKIKGLGPKKIATIWKELEVESIGELLYACNENRLLLYKGFGEKTQSNVRESIEFYLNNQGSHLYAQIESYVLEIDKKLQSSFATESFLLTGDFKRQLEIIDRIQWVTTVEAETLKQFFEELKFEVIDTTTAHSQFKGHENVVLHFYHSNKQKLYWDLFTTSCSEIFLEEWKKHNIINDTKNISSEEEIFEQAGLNFIPAYLREETDVITTAKNNSFSNVIQSLDVKAIIHSHSKWSDGVNTIEEMATAAKAKGLEYLVISDHSKTAFYAHGLTEERVRAQHNEIDELNKKLAPFKIFKSIESDILNDGSLDYSNDVLNTFDIVIGSIHSNFKMTEEKATTRLIKAIENPYISILGHMTGRLLLSRNGYPVDHKKIIEACVANNVVIELNAHPRRLDIDRRWIPYALQKGALISIDPDAHSADAFRHVRYGVLSAQKAALTSQQNLSSFSIQQFQQFLHTQHSKRNKVI